MKRLVGISCTYNFLNITGYTKWNIVIKNFTKFTEEILIEHLLSNWMTWMNCWGDLTEFDKNTFFSNSPPGRNIKFSNISIWIDQSDEKLKVTHIEQCKKCQNYRANLRIHNFCGWNFTDLEFKYHKRLESINQNHVV